MNFQKYLYIFIFLSYNKIECKKTTSQQSRSVLRLHFISRLSPMQILFSVADFEQYENDIRGFVIPL